jgi:hypothetical protein
MLKVFIVFLFLSSIAFGQNIKYRYLPPKPSNPPALNNTVNPQLANQNINFNSGNLFRTTPQITGTFQLTQINTPATRINYLYGFNNQPNYNTGFLNGTITPSGYNPFNNPYYQMATNMIGGYGGGVQINNYYTQNNYQKYFGFNGGKGI